MGTTFSVGVWFLGGFPTEKSRSILTSPPLASLDDYLSAGGSEGLTKALAMAPRDIIQELKRSRLRGRGGAGFPTGAKWETVAGSDPGAPKYAVCNAAEGEPGTFKDRWLMRRNPYLVVEGLGIASFAIGAERGYIALKRAFAPEKEAIGRAVAEMTKAGLLGAFEIDVFEGPDEYLFGEEKGLMEVLEGNLPMPRILPPFQEGLFATAGSPNPTLVNNVETLANVPLIMRFGADWFRGFGTDGSPGTMLFTISGDVKTPGIYELPLGTPLSTLVSDVAGGPPDGRAVKAIFPGASAGILTAGHIDTPLDFDAMKAVGSGLGSAGFVVYDDSACLVQALLDFSRFLWVESCAQCPACKHGTADITRALERIESGKGTELDLSTAAQRTTTVTGGQRCALPSGEAALVSSCIAAFEAEFREHLERPCPNPRALPFAKFLDLDDTQGRFRYDEAYRAKGPDWMYGQGTGEPGGAG